MAHNLLLELFLAGEAGGGVLQPGIALGLGDGR